MRNFVVLLLTLFTGFCSVCTGQNDPDSLFVTFSKQLSGRPSDLIYLQTSKGIYETGEDLWFKAYQLNAQSFGLSDRSRTLYLQMMNDKDSVVWQEKYPVENGIACGHVYVDEKLPEGDYYLEAYTKHSFYKDTTGMLSSRKVRIVKNIARENQRSDGLAVDHLRFDVFPEGGNLISGLPSRLAFKATDGKGYPVEVEGVLFQGDTPLTEFRSAHDGMGALSFTPDQEKQYRIELKNGKSYFLPEIYSQGMALRLSKQSKKYLEFLISRTEGLPDQEICLLGQMRGIVCCVAKGKLKDILKIKMPISEFPYQGISEFTLFNNDMQPVAKRLVYVNPEKKLHIKIEPDKKTYAIREKATLKIKVTDERGMPLKTNLGIGVFDKAYTNPGDPVNILTHCYLSSQVRGKIHDPSYYFDEKNKDRMQALDLLLLTQGWSRYVWDVTDTVNSGNSFLADEISGMQTIGSKKKEKETQGSEQLIQISGAEGNAMFVWTDSTGHFAVNVDMMKEVRGGYMYLKSMLAKEHKPKLEIEDYFPQIDSIRKGKQRCYPIIDLSELIKRQILELPVVSNDSTILLDEVVVTRKARKPFRDKFMGRLDSLASIGFDGAWVCGCNAGFQKGGKRMSYLNDYMGYSHHPAGSPCSEPKERRNPVVGEEYELIKYEPKGANGIWIVTDIKHMFYRGPEYTEEQLLRLNGYWRMKGYYAKREFYQPDEVDMQLSTPDARNTLLWAPSVLTDEKGEASVSFYCSDINTEFIGVVEGVDGAGLLGSEKCSFRVVRNY